MTPVVPAVHAWPTNGHLIEAAHQLGYLRDDDLVLDCTYGLGVFWQRWIPRSLIGTDLDPAKSPCGLSVDFRYLPYSDSKFDAVVIDPPYKLNGTPTKETDERYGVHQTATWRDRVALMLAGLRECIRVAKPGGIILAKCQDQVVSGHVVWQTDLLTRDAENAGCVKIDRLDMTGTSRPQPAGRRQVHAHGRPSSLLVFRRCAS